MRTLPASDDVTELLRLADAGASGALDRLYGLVYHRLRQMAHHQLCRERANLTLRTTDLVHEAYLRLVKQTDCRWRNRAQFHAIAAQAMRRILVDHARRRQRLRHGGGWKQTSLTTDAQIRTPGSDELTLALNDALDILAMTHPEKVRLVEMRYFAGLTEAECAEILGISRRTAARHWDYARTWLYRQLRSPEGPPERPTPPRTDA